MPPAATERWRFPTSSAGSPKMRRPGRPGVSRLDLVLKGAAAGRPIGSWLEREALSVIERAGLPKPQTQFEVTIDGQLFYIDLFYERAGLAIELSGHGTHATRRERQDDAERAALIESLGYHVVTFTYEDVTERPGYVVGMLPRRLNFGQGR